MNSRSCVVWVLKWPCLSKYCPMSAQCCYRDACYQYSDVIMSTMASQITSLAIVYSTVYSGLLKLRVTGICEGNSPVTGEFPTQSTSNAENVSIWWRHHEFRTIRMTTITASVHLDIAALKFLKSWEKDVLLLSSLVPWRCGSGMKSTILKFVLQIDVLSSSVYEVSLWRMPKNSIDDKYNRFR